MFPFLVRDSKDDPQHTQQALDTRDSDEKSPETFRIDPQDPILNFLTDHPETVSIQDIPLESPGVTLLKQAGVNTIVPLVAQGELVGMINLGRRMSTQEYSLTDRQMLDRLSTQAAIAIRVAELVEIQQKRARQLERMDHELQIAQVIQKTLLPKSIPNVDGWKINSYWNPAHTIGGDFYDFIPFPDGRLGMIIGDVTDKGIPAALVMAETRSVLRAVALRIVSPGAVLERVNDLLGPDIPDRMFITCLYVLVDPVHGYLRIANAGHNLPIISRENQITEVMVRGMPLGIFPGMKYEEVEMDINTGSKLILYSDGITEAHNPGGELYGTQRLIRTLGQSDLSIDPVHAILDNLASFTGATWEQEDDITIVSAVFEAIVVPPQPQRSLIEELYPGERAHILTEFSLPSLSGNDRIAMEKVADVLEHYNLAEETLRRLRTSVAETTLNAIEHGNQYQPELPVTLQVLTTQKAISIRISDCGEAGPIQEPATPDLTAKLAGAQTSRGWGLFLIRRMVDDMRIFTTETGNTVELLYRIQSELNY